MAGKTNLIRYLTVCLFAVSTVSASTSARIIYVDDDAIGANNGTSWTNAYRYLQDALAASWAGDEIYVAQGIYKPDQGVGVTPGDRDATFQLKNGVALKGGYAGFSEPDPDARNIVLYETILSGDLGGNDVETTDPRDLLNEPSRAENSYHVVTGSETIASAVIDGFVITGGNAFIPEEPSYYQPDRPGGGMFIKQGSPTITNCVFTNNSAAYDGGGIYNDHGSPIVEKCTFIGNYCRHDGAGLRHEYGSPSIKNCKFVGNVATEDAGAVYCSYEGTPIIKDNYMAENSAGNDGGAIYCSEGAAPLVVGNMFRGNVAYSNGGAIGYRKRAKPTILNNTFVYNKARSNGGAIWCRNSTCEVRNNIIKENTADDDGGGLYFKVDSLTVVPESIVAGNTIVANAADDNGGGVYCRNSSPELVNNVIAINIAGDGAGVWFRESAPVIRNCTISSNIARDVGGGICCRWSASPKVLDSIVWANKADAEHQIALLDDTTITVKSSDVESGWPGNGNIDIDPFFAMPGYRNTNGTPADANDDTYEEGDYHLKSQAGRWDAVYARWSQDDVTSPCIDSGDMSSPIGAEPFPNGGRINMGAYGGTAEASKSYFGEPLCETIVAGDINGDCKVDFDDFVILAFHWLEDSSG